MTASDARGRWEASGGWGGGAERFINSERDGEVAGWTLSKMLPEMLPDSLVGDASVATLLFCVTGIAWQPAAATGPPPARGSLGLRRSLAGGVSTCLRSRQEVRSSCHRGLGSNVGCSVWAHAHVAPTGHAGIALAGLGALVLVASVVATRSTGLHARDVGDDTASGRATTWRWRAAARRPY